MQDSGWVKVLEAWKQKWILIKNCTTNSFFDSYISFTLSWGKILDSKIPSQTFWFRGNFLESFEFLTCQNYQIHDKYLIPELGPTTRIPRNPETLQIKFPISRIPKTLNSFHLSPPIYFESSRNTSERNGLPKPDHVPRRSKTLRLDYYRSPLKPGKTRGRSKRATSILAKFLPSLQIFRALFTPLKSAYIHRWSVASSSIHDYYLTLSCVVSRVVNHW